MQGRRPLAMAAVLWLGALVVLAGAQEKDKEKTPRILALTPINALPGVAINLRVRGLLLDNASEVRFPELPGVVLGKIGDNKRGDMITGFEAAQAGDTQLEFKVTLPAYAAPGVVRFEILTAAGRVTGSLGVLDPARLLEEVEPNGSFRKAQSVEFGKLVRGSLKEDKDVDVFAIAGHAQKKISAVITAAARGSLLDSILTLCDAQGHVLATNDDAAAATGRDSALEYLLPADGTYYLSVTDANDRGGPWHSYELTLRELP